jgi:hypothetical protein
MGAALGERNGNAHTATWASYGDGNIITAYQDLLPPDLFDVFADIPADFPYLPTDLRRLHARHYGRWSEPVLHPMGASQTLRVDAFCATHGIILGNPIGGPAYLATNGYALWFSLSLSLSLSGSLSLPPCRTLTVRTTVVAANRPVCRWRAAVWATSTTTTSW